MRRSSKLAQAYSKIKARERERLVMDTSQTQSYDETIIFLFVFCKRGEDFILVILKKVAVLVREL